MLALVFNITNTIGYTYAVSHYMLPLVFATDARNVVGSRCEETMGEWDGGSGYAWLDGWIWGQHRRWIGSVGDGEGVRLGGPTSSQLESSS